MWIDCDNPNTVFEEFGDVAASCTESLNHEFSLNNDETLGQLEMRIECVGQYRRLLEPLIEDTCDKLRGAMITGWHQTRVLDAKTFIADGLTTWNLETCKAKIMTYCELLGMNEKETQAVLAKGRMYLERDQNRRDSICFYSTRRIEKQYLQYADTFGGETFTWAVEALGKAHYIKLLHTLGEPLAIKFEYPFNSLSELMQERAALAMLRAVIIRHTTGETLTPAFDGAVNRAIPAKSIIEVVCFNDDGKTGVCFPDGV